MLPHGAIVPNPYSVVTITSHYRKGRGSALFCRTAAYIPQKKLHWFTLRAIYRAPQQTLVQIDQSRHVALLLCDIGKH